MSINYSSTLPTISEDVLVSSGDGGTLTWSSSNTIIINAPEVVNTWNGMEYEVISPVAIKKYGKKLIIWEP